MTEIEQVECERKSGIALPEFHPLANIFPLVEGDEFEQLVASVKENGLRRVNRSL